MHVHWSYADVMDMEHAERRRWVRQVAQLMHEGEG